MPTMKFAEIVFDEAIYPRASQEEDTIKFYMERLMAGDKPPPIILETGTNRLMDGRYRTAAKEAYASWYKDKATKEERKVYPKPSDEIEVEYEEIPEDIPPKLWCAQYNRDHGERISGAHSRLLARELYRENPKISQGLLGTCLGRHQTTIGDYIKDLKDKEDQKREWDIEILCRLGWTQKEIAEATELNQSNVSRAICEIRESLKSIKAQLAKAHQTDKIAEAYNMPLILATALDLDRVRDDRDRAKQLGVNIRPHDAWQFRDCRDLFGHDYPGRIPGDLLWNVLYFYTKQNDIVLDPMAGSGTAADVCLVADRRCYCYDIENRYDRPEIRPHDLYRDGWPPRTENADLIFWDPPYFWKKDADYGEKSISRLDRDAYLAFFARAFKLAYETTKATCTFALLMAGWYDYDDPAKSIYFGDYTKRLQKAGWRIDREILNPLPTHFQPHVYEKLCHERELASVGRCLFIAQKPV